MVAVPAEPFRARCVGMHGKQHQLKAQPHIAPHWGDQPHGVEKFLPSTAELRSAGCHPSAQSHCAPTPEQIEAVSAKMWPSCHALTPTQQSARPWK